MLVPKPASTSRGDPHPCVRREFRQIVAKASTMITQRPKYRNRACFSMIGLLGFTLTCIFLLTPPLKEPESIETILRKRLGASRFHKEVIERLIWSREHMKFRADYENQVAGLYVNLLQNTLNSRRVASIVLKESDANVAKAKRYKRCIQHCSRQPYHLRGRLSIHRWLTAVQNESLEGNKRHLRIHEGVWKSRHCTARHSVAIIIPYRSREKQLRILLHHLPTILKRQHINYSIFVVEQVGNTTTFNKGILMNAGFLTALARPAHGVTFHCFIFHDVDLLAEDDRNMYSCPGSPRHMSVAVDEFDYRLPYPELLGGVFAIRTEHFLEVNGYSNQYWGWGGEDDDMGIRYAPKEARVTSAFGNALRPIGGIGRYTSIRHPKLMPWMPLAIRRRLKRMTRIRYKTEGLNTVKYTLVKVEEKYQYAHLFVDVGQPSQEMIYNVITRNAAFNVLRPSDVAWA